MVLRELGRELYEDIFGYNNASKLLFIQQLNLPCFWELFAICLQLFFLGSLGVQFLQKQVRQLCPSGRQEKEAQSCGTNKFKHFSVNYSASYRATFGCSLLLLVTHLFMLLSILIKGHEGNCRSVQMHLLAEITQVISWIVSLLMVSHFPKRRTLKVPWILRAWWMLSFFQLLTETGVDIYSVVIYHKIPSIREYAAVFLNLGLCTYLLGISITGSTGINFSRNDITDPLLYGTSQKYIADKRQPSYAKANLLQLITFSWLNPLFAVGINKPLEQDEVPDLYCRDSAEFLSHSFSDKLNSVRDEGGPQTPSIYKVIFLFIRKKAAINALFAVISASASYVGPYLIDDFVKFLSKKKQQSIENGYVLALAFLSAKMVETVAQRQWVFGSRQLGMRLRAALISHIYKKGLHLSNQSRQNHSSGEIINYMSVDIQRITDLAWYLNIIWMLPIQISLAIYILHMSMGLGSLAGLVATAMVMICNVPITKIQKRFQSKIMESKDERMKATSEVLRNMKILKLQTWDNKYLHKLERIRSVEHNWIWKSLRLSAISAFIFWGAPTFISVVTFGACILMGIPLTAGRVLSALATFRMLQDPIFNLPDLLQVLAQAKVSVDRVASYLQEEEIRSDAVEVVPRSEADFEVEIRNGNFSWDPDSGTPTLSSINLKVLRGKKVAICGTVGSGKSSLLSAILGEIQKKFGTVKICGTKAYVPQSPWILTGNIRENILFGNSFDSAKYDKTIQACALEKDFELFSSGDLTEIGERGINMSGGQKQRIQIARAVYQDADIYLLDDPFSAVDAHTGTQLFKDCLMGILKDKTILYVTHQVEFLPAADLILVMQDGRITQTGMFEQLLQQNIGFEVLVGAHSQALESVLTAENSSKVQFNEEKKTETPNDPDTDIETVPLLANSSRHESEQNVCLETTDKGGRLVQDEEREKGSIGKEIYWSYLTAVKGGTLVPFIILAQSSFQILQVASNYWMAWASPTTAGSKPVVETTVLFSVYIILSVGSSLCVLLRAILVAITGLLTSQKFFTDMLHSILRAPMSFFDSTPTGRILNRASTDQSVLDLEIAAKLGWCAFSIIQILGAIAVMSQVAWQVFVLFIPVTAICIWYQRYYIPTARELARLSGIQRAPILHHFAESLSGAATIRAFAQEERFVYANLGLIDNHSRPWFHNISAMEWLSFRLNLLSNFVFAFCLVLLVSLPEEIINPSIAGLAVTYGLNLNVLQASVIWNMCNAENKMISVERILQYSKIISEAPLVIKDCRPPNNWPSTGTICFKNLQIRYAEHLPSVLKNITCTFPGQKKIGVVGRTGSGKSTLIQAIFRIVEPREGTIEIDDVDICKIGLHDLRGRLSIIPQDPTMFEGTIRGNLDPLGQYSDHEVWAALDKCQLGELVRTKENKLDATVVENGENWSVGQRQLVCLGRALLKRSSILVLDEATASVDSATDGVIQQIIRQEFKEQTVVTIAHRIHTVIDSDLVLVLSEGRVQEFDTPAGLLEREESSFSKLIKEYTLRSQTFNSLSNSHPSSTT
ncbi:putative ABC transporter C family member 15 [Aristolochia californica]|uniref:putative ABC transporter C family member 15 n=1 Tax=Aristolochia californica TaxID=171875 RepID=UPI0035D72392